jgi:hypothetical protein
MFKNPPSEAHCDIEKALVYFKPNSPFGPLYQVLGLKRLYDLLVSPIHRPILVEDYGIDDLAFQRLSTEADTFRQAIDMQGAIERQADQDAHLAVLQRSVTDRDAQIAAILASTSWRVTKPLRFARRLLRGRRYPLQ